MLAGRWRALATDMIPPLDCAMYGRTVIPSSPTRRSKLARYWSTTGPRLAFATVVLRRSNSRNSGSTSCEAQIGRPGASSRAISAARRSWLGSMKQYRKQIAIASTLASSSVRTAARTPSSSSGVTTSPSALIRSATSRRRWRGTSGTGLSKNRSYSEGRFWRRISSKSRKPPLVISPVRARRPSSIAFVATVEPCPR